ncbi:YtxH domain-containing protein [Psychroserpens mesophilus]|uniref:YtxH domain-containing protein n=1 Tax=Psychroserpens mesophilus TaxID=325473 RepID=UPI003D64E76E
MAKDSNTIIGILAGTAIGATLGILFAPDKGSKTRKRIADEAALQKERLASTAGDIKDRVVTEAELMKDKVASTVGAKKQTLDEQLDHLVTDASYKADDVISKLELKLKQLKEKNKKYHNGAGTKATS